VKLNYKSVERCPGGAARRRAQPMGASYSSGFVPQDLQHYQDFSLARVTQLHNKFKQLCDTEFENNGMRAPRRP